MKEITHKTVFLFVAILLSISEIVIAQDLEKQLDPIFEKEYADNEPGATVLVSQNGKILYRKAFGKANLELDVPMKPENVFELGSITKQFTAVAILQLMEEGKLSLEDPLSKYIPDYPRGNEIKIHHLLNHTSGIKSYTDLPSFIALARTDMTPTELIAVTKDLPMDFSPGEKYQYNNSAYIILGHIIEQVSKMPYEEYIQKKIFTPLGMNNSYYGSKSTIIPNRASGYQPTGDGYKNADYLSMTLPYAAGSLMSTVDDMLLWNQAVHNNTFISEKSKQLAFKNYNRNDGKPIYYGYGWAVNEIAGIPTVEHGGGIFGYTTSGVYVPTENLYVIVLTNTNAKSPDNVALQAAATVLKMPLTREPVILAEKEHQQWTGAYQFDDVARFITFEDGALYSQRDGGQKLKLIPVGMNNYQFEDSFTTYNFRNENGKRIAELADRIVKSEGIEADIEPSEEKEVITLSPEILSSYEGTFELAPGFEIVVTKENNSIFGQATGQPKFELFAESPDNFFLKAVPAKVVFNKDSTGKIESLTLFQGGREIIGKKTK
ncbi:MAG TPA: serine hydrolase [Gillisia sp.]|nr:serine hydrolase [Gillisia sp.]